MPTAYCVYSDDELDVLDDDRVDVDVLVDVLEELITFSARYGFSRSLLPSTSSTSVFLPFFVTIFHSTKFCFRSEYAAVCIRAHPKTFFAEPIGNVTSSPVYST